MKSGRSRRIRAGGRGTTGVRAGVAEHTNDPLVMHIMERMLEESVKANPLHRQQAVRAKQRITMRKFSWEG